MQSSVGPTADKGKWKSRFVAIDALWVRDFNAKPRLIELAWAVFDRGSYSTQHVLVRPPDDVLDSGYAQLLGRRRMTDWAALLDAQPFEHALEMLSSVDAPVWVAHGLTGLWGCLRFERQVAEERLGRGLESLVPRGIVGVCTQEYHRVKYPIVSASLSNCTRRHSIDMPCRMTLDRAIAIGHVAAPVFASLPDDVSEATAELQRIHKEATRPRSMVFPDVNKARGHSHKRGGR